MAPRGNDGLDFSPLVTHLVFLFTFILAFAGWWAAFIGQIIATSKCEWPLCSGRLTDHSYLDCHPLTFATTFLINAIVLSNPRARWLARMYAMRRSQSAILGEVLGRYGSPYGECFLEDCGALSDRSTVRHRCIMLTHRSNVG